MEKPIDPKWAQEKAAAPGEESYSHERVTEILVERDAAVAELSSLKATEAALREDLETTRNIAAVEFKEHRKWKEEYEELCKFANDYEGQRDTLRQQLAETLSTLEELADLMDDVRANEYEPDRFTTQPARALLSKLKASSDAGEGKENPYLPKEYKDTLEKIAFVEEGLREQGGDEKP